MRLAKGSSVQGFLVSQQIALVTPSLALSSATNNISPVKAAVKVCGSIYHTDMYCLNAR